MVGTAEGCTPQKHEQPVLMVWSEQQQLSADSMCWLACSSPDLLCAPAGAKLRCGSCSLTTLHFLGLSPGRFPATRVAFLHRGMSEVPGNPALYLGCGEFPWALPSELKR